MRKFFFSLVLERCYCITILSSYIFLKRKILCREIFLSLVRCLKNFVEKKFSFVSDCLKFFFSSFRTLLLYNDFIVMHLFEKNNFMSRNFSLSCSLSKKFSFVSDCLKFFFSSFRTLLLYNDFIVMHLSEENNFMSRNFFLSLVRCLKKFCVKKIFSSL